MEINRKYEDLDEAITKLSALSKIASEENILRNDFINKYLTNFELRPYLRTLFYVIEEMEKYSLTDFDNLEKKGVIFLQSPRYDFSCHEESAREMLYSFSSGESKFRCGLMEGLNNIVYFLSNYKAVLKFEERNIKNN